MGDHVDNRHKIIAALSVMHEGENASSLLNFMSDEDADVIVNLVEKFKESSDCKESMNKYIMHILSSEKFSSLSEVHPAWILEKLKDEPPRMIGLILRFLPSIHVKYILKNLPPMLEKQIPSMLESFSVDPGVLDIIRKKFESNFVPMRISRDVDTLGFDHLYYLKEFELDALFTEFGLTELAIALTGMSSKILKMVYNRLDIRDAKRLKDRIQNLPKVSPNFHKESRHVLLKIDQERVGAKKLLKAIGFLAFAKALDHENTELVPMIMQKLEPKDAYLLKRYVDESKIKPSTITKESRRRLFLETAGVLAREGRIDSAWSGLAPDEVLADSDETVIPDYLKAESTYSVHQLA